VSGRELGATAQAAGPFPVGARDLHPPALAAGIDEFDPFHRATLRSGDDIAGRDRLQPNRPAVETLKTMTDERRSHADMFLEAAEDNRAEPADRSRWHNGPTSMGGTGRLVATGLIVLVGIGLAFLMPWTYWEVGVLTLLTYGAMAGFVLAPIWRKADVS